MENKQDSCFFKGIKNNENEDDIKNSHLIYQSPIALNNFKKCNKESNLIFQSQSIFDESVVNKCIKQYEYNPALKQWDIGRKSQIHIENNGETYKLMQFHFHTPGEHILNGKSYSSEIHFVFESKNGLVFVIGFLIEIAKSTSTLIKNIIANKPFHIVKIDNYWSYSGSLTEPPFNQTVSWNVSSRILKITYQDFEKLIKEAKGSRPIQKRDGRDIVFALKC